MKYVINDIYDNPLFEAEIDCAEDAPLTLKKRLAVLWALKNRADLRNADLYGADLRDANLYDADLRNANLYVANLYGADLRDADLRGAYLRGADLRDADLYGADLRDADLRGADLYGANHIWSMTGIGQERRLLVAVRHDKNLMIQAGCFWGNEEEFAAAVDERYGHDHSYHDAVRLFRKMAKEAA